MSSGAKTMTDEERARLVGTIVKDSASVLAPHTQGRRLSFEISSNVAVARG